MMGEIRLKPYLKCCSQKLTMLEFIVGIDTSQKRHLCIIYGKLDNTEKLHKTIKKVFDKYGVRDLHFRKIPKRIKKSARQEFNEVINRSSGMMFHILELSSYKKKDRKKYFFKHIPSNIADCFKSLRGDGYIHFDVHDNFSVKGVANSTDQVIRNLIKEICGKFGYDTGRLKVATTKNKTHLTKIKQSKTKELCISGKVADSKNERVIIADMVLGYYLFKSNGIRNSKYLEKVKYKKI